MTPYTGCPMPPLEIEYIGPAAVHNQRCAVCHQNKAVLDMNSYLFQPCWACQRSGYKLRRSIWQWLNERLP